MLPFHCRPHYALSSVLLCLSAYLVPASRMKGRTLSVTILSVPIESKVQFGFSKLEMSFYGVVQSIFRYREPFTRDSRV